MLMHAMWSSGHILQSLGGGGGGWFLCILFALCLCSCVERTWRWVGRNRIFFRKWFSFKVVSTPSQNFVLLPF